METLQEISVQYKGAVLGKKITGSFEAYEQCETIYSNTHSNVSLKEYFFILLLNQNNRLIGYHKLSEGGIAGTVADIRLAFATALKCLATGMILCHNHPSGNSSPSQSDISLTSKFRDAGQLMDIQVLDHIILTEDNYMSFADDGLI